MPDSDKDGLSDELEVRLGTDPHDKDTDHDGIMDGAERMLGTDPKNFDTDGDGWSDGGEIAADKNPLHKDAPPPYGLRDHPTQPTADDPDADGLTTDQERLTKTDPNDPDSDNDGLGDWIETMRGTDPNKADPLPKPFGASGPGAGTGTGAGTSTADGQSGQAGQATPFPPDPSIDPNVELLGESARHAFLEAAKAQIGDPYKFGAEADPNDPNPKAFDYLSKERAEILPTATRHTSMKPLSAPSAAILTRRRQALIFCATSCCCGNAMNLSSTARKFISP